MRAVDVVAAWATQVSAAQWVLIGLIALLLVMMIVHALAPCCLEMEELFKHHGVGKEPLDGPQQPDQELWR